MSTNTMNLNSGSILPSRTGFSASPTGSARPSRPGQLSQSILDTMAGGSDPETIRELSHTSAAALLDRVHHTEDPAVVERVLTLVDREGVDLIAELWSSCEPDSLPGVLWRLYLLRTWMRKQRETIARLWRLGEPVATAASAIAGVDQAPTADDIARTADSILAGAFTGDFAVALERAAAFTDVVANGLRIEARHITAPYRHVADADDANDSAKNTNTGGGKANGGSVTGSGSGDSTGFNESNGSGESNGFGKSTVSSDSTGSGSINSSSESNGAGDSDAFNTVNGSSRSVAKANTRNGRDTEHHAAQEERSNDRAKEQTDRTRAARLMHTAGNLMATSKDFRHGAALWRRGKLE